MKAFFNVRNMAVMAMFTAISVVLARFAGVQVSENLRISFECVPIILTGIWVGPMAGGLVGALADIIGTFLSGYGTYFPLLTVAPVLMGVLPGLMARYLFRNELNFAKLAAVVIVSEILANLLYNSFALTLYYSMVLKQQAPFALLFATRVWSKTVIMVLDVGIVWVLHRALYKKVVVRSLASR